MKRSKKRMTWEQVSAPRGRNELPALLFRYCDRLPREELAKGVVGAWTQCEFPMRTLSVEDWKLAFAMAIEPGDYLDEGVARSRTELPSSIVLYRGAPVSTRNGMSWTSSLSKAAWFAARNAQNFGIHSGVFRVVAPRSIVLASIHESGRGENEFVLDPAGLTEIAELAPAEYAHFAESTPS